MYFFITENTAIYQVKRADRNEYLKIKVLPADYDGLLFFGLVHNHPNLYTRTIVNKLSSLSVENGKLLVYSNSTYYLAEDLHIRPVPECRNPVQLCLDIVSPTKREGKQRPRFLVRIPL